MKRIKKLGKVFAGSALLIGATIAGGAGLATAQNQNSMDLGDYPAPFVDDDGEVDTQIVVGESAKTVDVVGALNIAGSLGNAAYETTSESVSGASFGWSAMDGVSLDTRNDQLFFGSQVDTVRNTLVEDDLEVLEETTFRDDSGTETDITNYLNVGDETVSFGNGPNGLDDEDPALHVPVEAESNVGNSDYLFNLQANFEDSINFTSGDVTDEEIELFGKSYVVSTDTTGGDSGELVLLGSQDEVSVDSGESTTMTINDEEHTFEVVAVTDSDTAAFRLDGDLMEEDEDATFNVDGQTVRVSDVVQTNNQNSEGVVTFAVGSEEIRMSDGNPIQDEDEDDVEGTYVEFNGGSYTASGSASLDISSIDVYVGSPDDEEDYVGVGESFSHDLFENIEFHFGGLNPDAMEDSDATSEVEFSADGDDTAVVDYTASNGDSTSVEFVHDSDPADTANTDLEDSDQNAIEVYEGALIEEDEYFTTDAGDFSHMWEVTSVDADTGSNMDSSSEATIDLRDTATGNTVEVDLDPTDADGDLGADGDNYYAGTEIIDGQSYRFVLEGDDSGDNEDTFDNGDDSTLEFKVAWDSGTSEPSTGSGNGQNNVDAAYDTGVGGTGSTTSVFSPVDTESGSSVSLTKEADNLVTTSSSNWDEYNTNTGTTDESSGDGGSDFTQTLELPSTDSSSANQVTLEIYDYQPTDYSGTSADGSATDFYVRVSGAEAVGNGNTDTWIDVAATKDTHDQVEFRAGQTAYSLDVDTSGTEASPTVSFDVGVSNFQNNLTAWNPSNGNADSESDQGPAALVTQPEDDNDEEHSYVVAPQSDGSEYVEIHDGSNGVLQSTYSSGYSPVAMDSNDDMYQDYNFFGTFMEEDTDEQGSFTLNIPDGQATAGAAFTASDGSLSESGGAGSVDVNSPTGFPDSAALDSDVGSVSGNTILVGGPAVNELTQELADNNQTWSGSDYSEGDQVLDLVNDAFDDNTALVVAGYSGEDTRAAANYIADYADNAEELAGQTTLNLATQ